MPTILVVDDNDDLRITANSGKLEIRYKATAQLDQEEAPVTEIQETPYDQLPSEVLTFLNPSRYCESDELSK